MKAICFNSSIIFTDTYFVRDLAKAPFENIFSTGQKHIHLSKSREFWTLILSITTRGVLRTQSNIYNGAFSRKYLMAFSRYLFFQESSIVDVWLGSKCSSDSIHLTSYLRENNKNLAILLDGRIILYSSTTQKIKWVYINTLTISNKFYFFCHCIPCIGHNTFSLYPLSYLSNSTGYCFLFSHNISSSCKVSAVIMSTFVPLFHFHL